MIADAAGNLFGTTFSGGAFGKGTVFEYDISTEQLITLASFNGTNGANPVAGLLVDGNGNLFGTTSTGGASGGHRVRDCQEWRGLCRDAEDTGHLHPAPMERRRWQD